MFARGAEAAERVLAQKFPDVAGKYVCPLCLLPFPEKAAVEHPLVLTLEHAPPKASEFQRAAVALTCVECNHRGQRSEAHLAEYVRKLNFPRTRRLGRRRMIISKGGASIRALMEIDGTRGRMIVPSGENEPDEISRFNAAPSDSSGMRW